jgi:O-antigen ligase
LFAIIYYFDGFGQFITPNFGFRTCGTFRSPNILYPVCLIGLLISFIRSQDQTTACWKKVIFFVFCILDLVALIFTFERAAWIALAIAVSGMLMYDRFNVQFPKRQRIAVSIFVVILLIGVFVVRCGGHVGSIASDRSIVGRIAIWNVACDVVMKHPWFGTGVDTYYISQSRSMTAEMAMMNPSNAEPKSLILNIMANFGVVGFCVLSTIFIRLLILMDLVRNRVPFQDAHDEIFGIFIAILAICVAGIVDTPVFDGLRAPSTFVLSALVGATCNIAWRLDQSTRSSSRSAVGFSE